MPDPRKWRVHEGQAEQYGGSPSRGAYVRPRSRNMGVGRLRCGGYGWMMALLMLSFAVGIEVRRLGFRVEVKAA